MSNYRVSIVVPIYRTEAFLRFCVDSIRNQTLNEIEIILVDDGSPDNCGEIADQYASQYPNIKVIHQENAGLGPARNSGIQAATGDYVGFVDSDDWAAPEMFLRLYQAAIASEADIATGGYCEMNHGNVTRRKIHPLAGTTLRDKSEILAVRKNLYGHELHDPVIDPFPMSVWISVYKRSFLEENSLRFENILSEDIIFNLAAYRCANVLTYIHNTDYCYRKEQQASITSSFSDLKMMTYQHFMKRLAELAKQEDDLDCILRAKRTAIDYCRMYVGIVDQTSIPLKKKKAEVRRFAENKAICLLWQGYPLACLPIQQRIFHSLIEKKCYGLALFMNTLRQKAKKIGWK